MRRAALAGTVNDHVVSAHAVPEPGREPVDGALQRRVLELSDPPAAVADDVMVVLAARHARLVASLGIPELDPVQHPVAMQQVERPVDARGGR